jgi:hypothetical protein
LNRHIANNNQVNIIPFVLEGTPENGEIEVKTISQEEYGQARFIDLFVFHAPAGPEGDCPGHSELVCRASTLDEAVSIFLRYCQKVGLTADICKARVDLTTRKVLDAEPHFCRQISPTNVEVAYDAPCNFGAKEKEGLIEDIQGYFDSHPQRRIYVDAFQQDPEVQVVACLGKEFNPDGVLIISTFASEKQKGA